MNLQTPAARARHIKLHIFIAVALDENIFLSVLHFRMKNIKKSMMFIVVNCVDVTMSCICHLGFSNTLLIQILF